jgi:hypothetical protein
MSQYIIAYTVPVFVTVDTDEPDDPVIDVVVGDEQAKLDEGFGNQGVVHKATWQEVTDFESEQVFDLADDAEWPAWRFG